MRTSNILRHLDHIAALSLGAHVAIPEMMRVVGHVLPGAAAAFFWMTEDGSVEDVFASSPDTPATPMTGRSGLVCVDAGNDVQISFGAAGHVRGVLALRRRSGFLAFGERERQVLRASAAAFARALETVPQLDVAYDAVPSATAVVVTDRAGKLVSADDAASTLLAQIEARPMTAVAPAERGTVPAFLADLVTSPDPRAAMQTIERKSRWGCFRASSFAQRGSDDITAVIVITKHLPAAVRVIRMLEGLELSPRERQVAFQLASGFDPAAAAAALDVSMITLRSYTKRIYQRLDVRSRFDLIARLRSDQLAVAA